MNGWIKLHRQILDWEWYTDLNTKSLFLHLLLMANIVPQKRVLGYTLQPGQIITTLPRLSTETGLSVQQLRRALKNLESSGEVSQIVTNKFRLITVEKWGFFQSEIENATDKQRKTKPQNQLAIKISKIKNACSLL